MAAGHGVGDDCFLVSVLLRRHPVGAAREAAPFHAGSPRSGFVREGDIVDTMGELSVRSRIRWCPPLCWSCGTVDGPDLVLCAALRGWGAR